MYKILGSSAKEKHQGIFLSMESEPNELPNFESPKQAILKLSGGKKKTLPNK